MTAYYNEFDPFAAQWLRNLIDAGEIAPGVVDERSIEDVTPDDLAGFTQCHWFAGIAGWPLALRRAGWPDDRPVWTGSCPCQPFSSAGKGGGFTDERHLWPAWQWLIEQRRPPVAFGEQVSSKTVEPWIDLVQADLEALGYAFGCIAFPAAGVGAPNIRDRAYWVGHTDGAGLEGHAGNGGAAGRPGAAGPTAEAGVSGRVGDTNSQPAGRNTRGTHGAQVGDGANSCDGDGLGYAGDTLSGGLANTNNNRREPGRPAAEAARHRHTPKPASGDDRSRPAGPTNGIWGAADWLFCRDEKWRPVEPGTFPLVDGLPARMGALSPEQARLAELAGLDAASLKRAKSYRVGQLKGYGNAINVEAAVAFIEAYGV